MKIPELISELLRIAPLHNKMAKTKEQRVMEESAQMLEQLGRDMGLLEHELRQIGEIATGKKWEDDVGEKSVLDVMDAVKQLVESRAQIKSHADNLASAITSYLKNPNWNTAEREIFDMDQSLARYRHWGAAGCPTDASDRVQAPSTEKPPTHIPPLICCKSKYETDRQPGVKSNGAYDTEE